MKSSLRHKIIFTWTKITFFIVVIQLIIPNTGLALLTKEENSKDIIKNAIVKVYTMKSQPYYFIPWMTLPPKNISGSGCIIEGNKILTNAHVVANQTFIQVRRYGESRRYNAKVLSISHESDLALLTVDDKTFFSVVEPLKLGELPETKQEITVYGFPVGGDTLSITKGILSRIEHHMYVHSSSYFLAGQIDAAINPGNSGGPVLVDNQVIGVVMQSYDPENSENIGYMVPTPVIKHFLQDIEDGYYDGFPDIGLVVQKIENPDMKRKYEMSEEQNGVVVNHIIWGSSAENKIKKDDILLSIDGHPIAGDGTVEFRPKERTVYTHFIQMHQLGEKVNIDVLRNGTIKSITLALNQTQKDFLLVPAEQYDRKPRYFIFGGIIFSPLTKDIINERKDAPEDLIIELENWPTEDKKEVVIAIRTLAADINKGYHDLDRWIVTEVNGKKFRDFNEFFHIVATSAEPYISFKNSKGFQIVLDRKRARETHKNVLQAYNIQEDRSSDLKQLYTGIFFSQR